MIPADDTSSTGRASSLEDLTAKWRAVARYGIMKSAIGCDQYSRVKALLPEHTGLTWDEANQICDKLNKEAYIAAGCPSSNWGLTQYYPKLETPLPSR